jgi:hypothetical protein
MTALLKDRKTDEYGTPDNDQPLTLSFPVAASTTIYGGAMVATNASGDAVPVTASTALKIWGRCEAQVVNTVAAGFGTAGDLQVKVRRGTFLFNNGTGANAIAAANVGDLCYASDDNIVNLTDGAGLWPCAGVIYKVMPDGQIAVAIGATSLYSTPTNEDDVTYNTVNVRARNVVNGDIADLTAYTVASNAAVNDATLNVAGDIVLLVAQATPAQNGIYVVGTVAVGVAPLTRHSSMPAGKVFVADEYLISVRAGTVFAHTNWFNSAAGTVATNTPAFYPEHVTITQALVAGTIAALISVPILSATKTGFTFTRSTANTCSLTDGGYVLNGNPTPGALGTASAAIMASVLAGTINVADVSTLHITITNR